MDSYNSQYPLEYYEIGTPYMFYMSTAPKQGKASTTDEIKKFAPVLTRSVEQESDGYSFAQRYIGVVVGKKKFDGPHPSACIEVMFQGNSNGKTVYMNARYIVAHSAVFCNDKEQFEAAKAIDLSNELNLDFSNQMARVSGGIALDMGKRSGGIALDKGHKNGNGGIALDM